MPPNIFVVPSNVFAMSSNVFVVPYNVFMLPSDAEVPKFKRVLYLPSLFSESGLLPPHIPAERVAEIEIGLLL